MAVSFDELQGRRFARDTLLDTPPLMLREVAKNLRNTATKRPADYARGMIRALEELKL